MATRIGSIILFVIFVAASDADDTVSNQSSFKSSTNDELLAKLNGLDDRFEKEMRESNKRLDQVSKALDKAYNKIASLEENNVKLMEELSDARDRIISLERKAEVKSLYKRPGTASDNKDHQWNSTHFASEVFVATEWDKQKSYSMPRSCAEARSSDPSLQSGNYYVDPDGTNIGDNPIYVFCDMSTGTTLVGHDSEATIDVGNCNAAGCYTRAINYAGGATTRQLAALVDLSTSCCQFIRYDCFDAPFELNGVVQSWWNDRNGAERYFWAGANTNNNRHMCQCGIDGNCVDPSQKCNCDAMAVVQLTDNGYVTEKSFLPVTRLNFGRIAPGASGRHTLGKFECSGRTTLTTKPTNCYDFFIAGNQISGFYTIKGSATQLKTVYCDYTKAQGASGYETAIGYLDVKTSSGVSFYVQRQTDYSSIGSVITYEVEKLNVGGAMNLATGVFTAPVDGRYHFTFTARAYSPDAYNNVYLRLNGVNIGLSFAPSYNYNLPLVGTFQLKRGDTVDVYLYQGSIGDSVQHHTQFSGFLLEEDLVL